MPQNGGFSKWPPAAPLNFLNMILSAIKQMKISIIGFLMMQNSNLTSSHRSHDQKWLKMADFQNGRSFFNNVENVIFSAMRPIKMEVIEFLMAQNSNFTLSDG